MKRTQSLEIGFGQNLRKIARSLCAIAALLAPLTAVPCLLTIGTAEAQNSNATVRGQVLDPSGAVIPNAKVSIVNESTNVNVFDGQTDSAGVFVVPQVVPGSYKVTVTAPGWKQAVVSDLLATVAQVTAVNVTRWRTFR